MTNKELSQAIRQTLKKAGYSRTDYSIKVRDSLYDTAVHITIKNPLIRISDVEKIVNQFEEIDRDERTYEILAGCNTYIHCQYDYGIFDEVAAPFIETSKKVLNNEKYDGRKIAEDAKTEIHMIKVNNNETRLYEYSKEEKRNNVNHYRLYSAQDLAVAIWRFKNLGTIFA